MKSYKVTGLQPRHLASRDELFNLDSEWRDLTFPTDSDTWNAGGSNESELRLTCAQCGCCLEEVPEDGDVYCPDCGGEFFYVSRLITRQIIEVNGISAYLSPNRFLHFKLPSSLPDGYQLHYTWGDEKPTFQSAHYTRPCRCPDGVTKIQYFLLFPDDTCTRVMQDTLAPSAETLPPYRSRRVHTPQPTEERNDAPPAQLSKPVNAQEKLKGCNIPIITFLFLFFTTPWSCSTFPVLGFIIMAGIMISVYIFTKNIKKERKRKNICTAILCAIIACCGGVGLLYINSPQYEWKHVSGIPLPEQLLFLKNHPQSANRKKLSKAIVQQLSTLSNEEIDHLDNLQNLDEGVAYKELTATPTLKSLDLFLKLFPETSDCRKQKIHKLKVRIAEQEWNRLRKPYTLGGVRAYLSKFEGIVEPSKIQQRVCTSILQSTDVSYIKSFLDFIEDSHLTALLDQRIAELEEKAWIETYANSSSEATLLRFQETLRSEKVKQLVNQRLQELYSSFDYAQKVDTIEAYERFIRLSFNPEEIEEARKRIVDLEVAEIARGRHAALPPQHNKVSQYTHTGYAEIELKNDTSYPLIARYSGNESEKIIIPALEKATIKIRSGMYDIAVSTTQSNVIPFYGKEYIDSGKYQVRYYISSTPTSLPRTTHPYP